MVTGSWLEKKIEHQSTSLLAEKSVLIMVILAGKKGSRSWKLDEGRSLARRWEQLCLSRQHKKFDE